MRPLFQLFSYLDGLQQVELDLLTGAVQPEGWQELARAVLAVPVPFQQRWPCFHIKLNLALWSRGSPRTQFRLTLGSAGGFLSANCVNCQAGLVGEQPGLG